VHATEDDAVIFCGTGATGAINTLVDILNIRIPGNLDGECELGKQIPDEDRPVVFVGPYEHHSNELPWRESTAEGVAIDLDPDGGIEAWNEHPNIRILCTKDRDRISIVSFVIRYGDQYLHWNFVVPLLNDLFGIQARGGCSCAGPYGHRLLGIEHRASEEFEKVLQQGYEGVRPGWVRLNFNYFISEPVVDFLIDAVRFVADEGWKLLPQYEMDPVSGLWRHRRGHPEPLLSLKDISYESLDLSPARLTKLRSLGLIKTVGFQGDFPAWISQRVVK